ncbi:MAG TPA: arsenic transporter, partial [Deinococcales bacterium]|nr:arsenic transporter [Deinococcales bacterium]
MFLAAAIFLLTLVLVVWRPKVPGQPDGLGIGYAALIGAGLALATGAVHLADVPRVAGLIWNATLTFVALVVISLLLDEAGLFEWAALHVARLGRGRGPRLFTAVVLLGALTSALFANDGAALILTPIVLEMVLALGFTPGQTLAFAFSVGFIADASSLPLIVSNLTNIISADLFDLRFDRYAAVMLPVDLAAVAASLAVLLLVFRRAVPRGYDLTRLKAPAEAVRDPRTFRAGLAVMALLVAGYFAAGPLGVPVSLVAATAAVVLMAVASRAVPLGPPRLGVALLGPEEAVIDVPRVLKHAPWQVVLFSLGMYLVVYALRDAGLTRALAGVLRGLSGGGIWFAALGTGFITAGLSSVTNNLPAMLIGALSVASVPATPLAHQAMVYANVVGCDLGPKITPIGSLATLLWLHILARRGLTVSWGQYFRLGVVLTLPVLLVTLLALAA